MCKWASEIYDGFRVRFVATIDNRSRRERGNVGSVLPEKEEEATVESSAVVGLAVFASA